MAVAKKRKFRSKRPRIRNADGSFTYEGADAKETFGQLRFEAEKAEAGRVDVSGVVFPTPDIIQGELRYQFDGTDWAAVVTKDADGDGMPVFRLWYQRGDRFQKSGMFPDGHRLVEYIRQAAREKFKGFEPLVDTLDQIKHKSALSVVPGCFGEKGRLDTTGAKYPCATCPYIDDCESKSAEPPSDTQWAIADSAVLVSEDEPKAVEEPEAVFLRRLQGKVQSGEWED